jgi:hypothetical protein
MPALTWTTCLWVNIASTWAMVGIIWFVQCVHYPLLAKVGPATFAEYEDAHRKQTTWVVGPLMLLEVASTLALLWWPNSPLPQATLQTGVVLLAGIWVVTAGLSIPAHHRLSQGFSAQAHKMLVGTNWLRTALWTARGLLFLGLQMGWSLPG